MPKCTITMTDHLDAAGTPTGEVSILVEYDPPIHEGATELTPAQGEGAEAADFLVSRAQLVSIRELDRPEDRS